MPNPGQTVTHNGRLVSLTGPTAEDPEVWTGTDPAGGIVFLARRTIATLLGETPVASIQVTPDMVPDMAPLAEAAEPAPRGPTCPCCRRRYTGSLGVDHQCERISSVTCEHCEVADLEMLREPPRGAFVCSSCSAQGWFICKRCGEDKQGGHMKGMCDRCNPLRAHDIWAQGKRAVGDEVTIQTRSHRPFAVEIECFLLPDEARIPRTRITGWDEASDVSIRHDVGATEDREFRSPPFKGDGGLEKLYDGVAKFREMGFRANKSCGLHCHIDMADSSEEDRKALHKFGTWIEAEVFKLVAKTRGNNRFCRRLAGFESDMNDKYKWMSLQSYNRHKTVEFRLHHGCTQPEVVAEWAKVCLRIVEQGMKLGRMEQKPNGSLFELLDFSKYEKKFWLSSAKKLHGREVEVA